MIKLEVIADDETLNRMSSTWLRPRPRPVKDGFEVFPYCTEDLAWRERLVDAGCRDHAVGVADRQRDAASSVAPALKLLRERLPDITLVVDAGLGAPSHAAQAMELATTPCCSTPLSRKPPIWPMAGAFRLAVESGHAAHRAGLMGPRDFKPVNPCRWDTVLACRILIASIL